MRSTCTSAQPPGTAMSWVLPGAPLRKARAASGTSRWPSTSMRRPSSGRGAGRPASATALANTVLPFTAAITFSAFSRAAFIALSCAAPASASGITSFRGGGAAASTAPVSITTSRPAPRSCTVGPSAGSCLKARAASAARSPVSGGWPGAAPVAVTGAWLAIVSPWAAAMSAKLLPSSTASSMAATRSASASSVARVFRSASTAARAWSSVLPALPRLATRTTCQPSGDLMGALMPPAGSAKAARATSALVALANWSCVWLPSAMSPASKPAMALAAAAKPSLAAAAASAFALASSGTTTCSSTRVAAPP